MHYYMWCHGAAPQLGVGTVNELYCLLGLGFLCFGLWGFFCPFSTWFLLPERTQAVEGDDGSYGSAERYKLVLLCTTVRSWTGREQYKACMP